VLQHAFPGGNLELVAATDSDSPELASPATVDRVFATKQPSSTPPLLVVPLARPHDRTPIGVIALEGITRRPFDARQRSFLMVVASAVGAAFSAAWAERRLHDLLEAHAELAAREAQQVRESSLTLQHSLLTPPPRSQNLDIAVRYQPATKDLEIGGDWYDAFVTSDGATVLVIGFVTGHDHHAAAAMGQIRGLIRAIAFDSCSSPASVLEHTDRAIHGLRLGFTATATTVVVKVRPGVDSAQSGRTIEWSNAGHPSPILIRADGHVEVLSRTNDLILGISPDRERTNYSAQVEPGDTLLL
jgi:Stage II sporulation protein E (SpoIIE)/GAF domain